MDEADKDDVREKSRRIVARSVLKRASRMVDEWRQDEREKRVLARRIAVGLGLFCVFSLACYAFLYRSY